MWDTLYAYDAIYAAPLTPPNHPNVSIYGSPMGRVWHNKKRIEIGPDSTAERCSSDQHTKSKRGSGRCGPVDVMS